MDELIPIADRLFLIPTPTKGRFPMAFSFLVKGTDTRALIDTGCGEAACRMVLDQYGVDMVINSHCHPDHVSGNHLFVGKDLWVPEQRAEETGSIDRLARRLLGPDPKIMESWEAFVRSALGMADYARTHTFGDNQQMDFGGISLTAIHTPGHLDDHYCFLFKEHGILLSFDIDLTTFGPFYGNPEADLALFRRSLDKIRGLQPRVIASSHRMPVDERIAEELEDFESKFTRNQNRVAAALDRPRTLDEVCSRKPIYGKYLPGLDVIYGYFERHMVVKHLEEMLAAGMVKCREGVYFLP